MMAANKVNTMSGSIRLASVLALLLWASAGRAGLIERLAGWRDWVRSGDFWPEYSIPTGKNATTEREFQRRKAEILTALYLPPSSGVDGEGRAVVGEFFRRYQVDEYNFSWEEMVPRVEALARRYPRLPELRVLRGVTLQLASHDREAERLLAPLLRQEKDRKQLAALPCFLGLFHRADALDRLDEDGDEDDDDRTRAVEVMAGAVAGGAFPDLLSARVLYSLLLKSSLRQLDWLSVMQDKIGDGNRANPWLRDMVHGELHLARAWDLNSGESDSDSDLNFAEELERARTLLAGTWKKYPSLPEAPSLMIVVTMLDDEGTAREAWRWFVRSVRAQFDYAASYRRLMQAFSPDWLGSRTKLSQLGEAAMRTGRFDTEVPDYLFFGLMEVAASGRPWNWTRAFRGPKVKAELVRLFETRLKQPRPEPSRQLWRARYAVAMLGCGDLSAAGRQLDRLPPDFDFGRLKLDGWFGTLKTVADWHYEIRMRRSPDWKVIQTAAVACARNGTASAFARMRPALAAAGKDVRRRNYLIDMLGYMILEQPVGDIRSCHPVLHEAVLQEDWSLVALLLDCGADPNFAATCNRNTPLVLAAGGNDSTAVAELLLRRGSRADRPAGGNYTPLMAAARQDNPDMLKLLLRHGAPVAAAETGYGWTALHYAVYYCRHMESIQTLIRSGAALETRNRKGDTALLTACRHHRHDAAALLLENGADCNAVSRDGDSALMLAVRENQPETVRLLIRYGARRNLRNKDGKVAADYAKKPELRRLLAPVPAAPVVPAAAAPAPAPVSTAR